MGGSFSLRLLWLLTVLLFESITAYHVSPCGQTNLTDTDGTIKSPNYPKPFPSQVKCLWTIQSRNQFVLKLRILDLDLYHDCSQHWLSLPNEGGRGANRLCGRQIPIEPVSIVKPSITIEYYSSELKKESRGFTLLYSMEPLSCEEGEIQCNNGGCVSNSSRCNGVHDCEDGTDEMDCLSRNGICAEGTISCLSTPKNCFSPFIHSCDGHFHCPKGEDELNCAPGCPNQIACSSGDGCYDPAQRCNGIRNCRDNSDETECINSDCSPLEFICRNGGCIAAAALCDGIDDCGDASDEQHCSFQSSLLVAATIVLLACVFLSCIGLSCLYRFYTSRLRASTALLQELDPEGLDSTDDVFVYREPPPSYSVAISESHSVPRFEEAQPPARRYRRRQRRRRAHRDPQATLLALAKQRVVEQQWHTPVSSPSVSPSRDSVTSTTSVEDIIN